MVGVSWVVKVVISREGEKKVVVLLRYFEYLPSHFYVLSVWIEVHVYTCQSIYYPTSCVGFEENSS